jgi:hypothetical protein
MESEQHSSVPMQMRTLENFKVQNCEEKERKKKKKNNTTYTYLSNSERIAKKSSIFLFKFDCTNGMTSGKIECTKGVFIFILLKKKTLI